MTHKPYFEITSEHVILIHEIYRCYQNSFCASPSPIFCKFQINSLLCCNYFVPNTPLILFDHANCKQ